MKISKFASFLERLENTSSRIEITKILAELLRGLKASEIDKAVYLSLGILAPSYRGVVFNLAERTMLKIVSLAYGVSHEETIKEYKAQGDLGAVAQKLAPKNKTNLTVNEVYEKLVIIASLEGEGSTERKTTLAAELLKQLDPLSARFVTRIPLGKLRLGFSEKTIMDALSWMETGDKSKAVLLERSFEVLPDIGQLAQAVRATGIEKASKGVSPKLNTPILPMLPQRLKSTVEMINKMGRVAVEPKFDGLRVQIHYHEGHPVRAYTRNLNDISDMFPELNTIGKYIKAKSAILDSEAIGVDEATKKFADFQTTMNRRRKHGISESAKRTPLQFQIFDVMFLDGKNLMQEEYSKRRSVLLTIFSQNSTFRIDKSVVTRDPQMIKNTHENYVKQGLEGVLVKKTTSKYVPGRTAWRWVKMKEAEGKEGKLSDTVDCVVMGYTAGRGKRANFGLGQFLAGIKSGEKFLSITKVGTGLTDEQFKELNKRLQTIKVRQKPKQYEVHKDLEPDYWVNPEVVVELAADELTKSPKHTAGLALRFPRLVKFRDDKDSSETTTLKEIKNLYQLQTR